MVMAANLAIAEVTWFKDEGFVAWDAVTHLVSGEVIPVTDDPTLYRVQRKHRVTGAIENMGETNELQFPAAINAEGFFYIGVYCVRMFDGAPITVMVDGVEQELKSTTTWSNSTDTEAVHIPFGLSSW